MDDRPAGRIHGVNMLTSALALARYDARTSGEGPKNSIDTLLDAHFDDARMERIYPNAKKVAKADEISTLLLHFGAKTGIIFFG